MNVFIRCVQMSFQILLLFSLIASLIVLGVVIDYIVNGPDYVVKMVSNVFNKLHNEEILGQMQVIHVLEKAKSDFFVHIVLVTVVMGAVLLCIVLLIGCAGAIKMSYSLLSGFTLIMFLFFITSSCIASYMFSEKKDPFMDTLVKEKIADYYENRNSIFNIIIDVVQRDLKCCGFKSFDDWSEMFPSSCCPKQFCTSNNIFKENCQNSIKLHWLEPDSVIGVIGIFAVTSVILSGLVTLLSCCICVVSRSNRVRNYHCSQAALNGEKAFQESRFKMNTDEYTFLNYTDLKYIQEEIEKNY